MKTLALASLLLTLAVARAAAAGGPAWVRAKADARRWTDNLLAKVRADPRFDAASFDGKLGEAWKMAANIERGERERDAERAKAVPKERARSRRILELNLLYVYGNVLPRILDESTSEALPGRAYAGKDLALAIEEEPYRRRYAALVKGYQVSADLLMDFPPPKGN